MIFLGQDRHIRRLSDLNSGAVAVEMLISVLVVMKPIVTNAVGGGEYVTMLTDSEVVTDVTVSVVMLVSVETDV